MSSDNSKSKSKSKSKSSKGGSSGMSMPSPNPSILKTVVDLCSEEHGKSEGPILTRNVLERIGEQPTFLAIEAPVSSKGRQQEKDNGTVPTLDVHGLMLYEDIMYSIYKAITTDLKGSKLTPLELYNYLTSTDFAQAIQNRIPKSCGDQYARIGNIGQELARETNDSTTPEVIGKLTKYKRDYHEANAELYKHCATNNVPVYAVDMQFRDARSAKEVHDQASERNKVMARRIQTILNTTGVKSAVFLGGGAHIPEMSHILSSSTVTVNEFTATDRKELQAMLVRIYGEGSAMLGDSASHSKSSRVTLPPTDEEVPPPNASAASSTADASADTTDHSSRAMESKRTRTKHK